MGYSYPFCCSFNNPVQFQWPFSFSASENFGHIHLINYLSLEKTVSISVLSNAMFAKESLAYNYCYKSTVLVLTMSEIRLGTLCWQFAR